MPKSFLLTGKSLSATLSRVYCNIRSFPQKKQDTLHRSIHQAIRKLPASTKSTETIKKHIPEVSKLKKDTKDFVITVKIGEKTNITNVFLPIYRHASLNFPEIKG